jgi:membrane protein required for colicin V production
LELTFWDWLILVIGGLSVLIGLWRGMVRSVFALAGWIIALIGTPLLFPTVAEMVKLEQAWLLAIPIFLVLFIAVRLIGGLLAAGLTKAGLGGVDRLLGGLIGILRAAIIVGVLALLAKQFGWHEEATWKNAQARPLLDAMVYWIEPLLPERFSGIKRT